MALPYPTKVVLPFDIATAQDMNERHANDVALANGTGLNDNAITTPKLADGAVTAPKIDFTTYSTTEKVVGTWIDGKTIYSRTFTGSITGAAGSRPSQQLTTGVDTLVLAEGTWRYGDAGDAPWVPIGYVITTGSGAINTNIGLDARREANTGVTISSTTTYARTTGTNYRITLEYTKS